MVEWDYGVERESAATIRERVAKSGFKSEEEIEARITELYREENNLHCLKGYFHQVKFMDEYKLDDLYDVCYEHFDFFKSIHGAHYVYISRDATKYPATVKHNNVDYSYKTIPYTGQDEGISMTELKDTCAFPLVSSMSPPYREAGDTRPYKYY